MLEFTINKFITIKLENEKINLYINGELFEQCSIILLNKQADGLEELEEIKSIDELTELSVDEVVETPYHTYEQVIEIPAQLRFLVQCSNIQAWAENNSLRH